MWARRLFNAEDAQMRLAGVLDPNAGIYRAALLVDDRIAACVFLSPRPDLPSRTWLSGLFARKRISERDRAGLLLGQSADPRQDTGPVVCSCFGVGRKTICDAIARDRSDYAAAGGRETACRHQLRLLRRRDQGADRGNDPHLRLFSGRSNLRLSVSALRVASESQLTTNDQWLATTRTPAAARTCPYPWQNRLKNSPRI